MNHCELCKHSGNCDKEWRYSKMTYPCEKYEHEQTNEEYLRSLNTEQLADWLTDTFDLCGAGCSNCLVSKKCLSDDCNEMPTELIVDWLKKVHHDNP